MMDVIPRSGEFSNGKLWFERKGSTLTIGLTSAAVEELGEIESVDLLDEGESLEKGEVAATVEGSLGTIELLMPVSGTISEINLAAQKEPYAVSEDPREGGWLVRFEAQDLEMLKNIRT
jgi:glycine cleavage system H protein